MRASPVRHARKTLLRAHPAVRSFGPPMRCAKRSRSPKPPPAGIKPCKKTPHGRAVPSACGPPRPLGHDSGGYRPFPSACALPFLRAERGEASFYLFSAPAGAPVKPRSPSLHGYPRPTRGYSVTGGLWGAQSPARADGMSAPQERSRSARASTTPPVCPERQAPRKG